MSVALCNRVLSQRLGLSITEKAVLSILAFRLDEKTNKCYPSITTIANSLDATRQTIITAIKKLEERGFVKISIIKTPHGNGHNYEIVIPSKTSGQDLRPLRGQDLRPLRGLNDEASGLNDEVRGLNYGPLRGLNLGPNRNRDKQKDRVCDRGQSGDTPDTPAHTHNFSNPNEHGANEHIAYDVKQAISMLSNGGKPVPRTFIEERARLLSQANGATSNGKVIPPQGFIAHCQSWWDHERDKERYLEEATKAPIPQKKKARVYSEKDWTLCRERCKNFVDGKCLRGRTTPPDKDPDWPLPPERCDGFNKKVGNSNTFIKPMTEEEINAMLTKS